MLTKQQISSPTALVSAIVDNNLGGVKNALIAAGYQVFQVTPASNVKEIILAQIEKGNGQKIAEVLSSVLYVNDNPNYTGGLSPVSFSKSADGTDTSNQTDWGAIVSGIGTSVASIVGAIWGGNNGGGAPAADNSATILGLQKTMFYSILAILFVMVLLIVVVFKTKK